MELDFIRWLRGRLPAHPRVSLGPGDDAAVVQFPGHSCVWTVDLLTDGVDFELETLGAARVGRKVLAVNLSDLAAMAARPVAALIALALPRADAPRLARELYEGLLPLAHDYKLAIAGGDTNTWDGRLVVSITLLGDLHPRGPLTRAGAKAGDKVVVTGQFGGSILGHHFDFEPRVNEAIELMSRYELHAGIDVSDSLSLDLWRLAEESGCGAELNVDKIPIAPAAFEAARHASDGRTALDHALEDGEDFELILAVAPQIADAMVAEKPIACGLACIGQFVAEKGLWQIDGTGARRALAPRGFEH